MHRTMGARLSRHVSADLVPRLANSGQIFARCARASSKFLINCSKILCRAKLYGSVSLQLTPDDHADDPV